MCVDSLISIGMRFVFSVYCDHFFLEGEKIKKIIYNVMHLAQESSVQRFAQERSRSHNFNLNSRDCFGVGWDG